MSGAAAADSPAAKVSPYELLPHRTIVLTMAGVLLGMLLAALDMTVVGTALPRVVADLGGFEHYAWVVTAYMVTSTVTLPLIGKLSDLHGRKRYYLLGILGFLAGSALCGASLSMGWLVVARAFQGIGAGIMQSVGFSVVADLFPPAQRGKVQGLTGSIFGLAAVVGPILGGYITDSLSWRWVFYINLPVGVLALIVLAVFFPDIRPGRAHRRIDVLGALLLVAAVVPLLLALSWGGTVSPWDSPQVLGLLAFAAVAGVVFIQAERWAAEPILPPGLVKHRVVANALLAVFLTACGMFGAVTFVPVYVQAVLGESATASGNVLAPLMVSFFLASTMTGLLISRTGRYKVFAIIGQGLVVLGLFLLSQVGSAAALVTLALDLVVLGVGLGMGMPTFVIAVQNSVSYQAIGTATSATQFARSIGGTLGTALMGALIANRLGVAMQSRLAGGLADGLPAALAQTLEHPQALVAPGQKGATGLNELLGTAGTLDPATMAQVAEAVRQALAAALQDAFLVCALIVAVSFVASWFLPEMALRGRGQATTPPLRAESTQAID